MKKKSPRTMSFVVFMYFFRFSFYVYFTYVRKLDTFVFVYKSKNIFCQFYFDARSGITNIKCNYLYSDLFFENHLQLQVGLPK